VKKFLPGQRLSAKTVQGIYDEGQANRPPADVSRDRKGWDLPRLRGGPNTQQPRPFTLVRYGTGWKVRGGRWMHGGTVYDADYGTGLTDLSSALSLSNSDTNIVYAKLDTDAAEVTVDADTSLPADTATTFHWRLATFTLDASGNMTGISIEWHGGNIGPTYSSDDEKVGVDADATPGYLGAASNDGVLRVDSSLTYTDGGDFVTIAVNESSLDPGSMSGLTEVTVVTDVRYDTSTHQLQIKQAKIKAIDPSTSSLPAELGSWAMITGGQASECDDT